MPPRKIDIERRRDMLTRSEFMESALEIREDVKQVLAYQRDTNGKVAIAFERLGILEERTKASAEALSISMEAARSIATLNERTMAMKDGPGRVISYASMAIAVITFLMGLMRSGVGK